MHRDMPSLGEPAMGCQRAGDAEAAIDQHHIGRAQLVEDVRLDTREARCIEGAPAALAIDTACGLKADSTKGSSASSLGMFLCSSSSTM
jgi:hypothetical protein